MPRLRRPFQMTDIRIAETTQDLRRCFPVMHELRPQLDLERFVAQLQRQVQSAGYRLAFVELAGNVVAAAGYRIVEMLAWGKALYVDDLVTAEAYRGQGHASRLFDWLVAESRRLGCEQFHLDSGVHRFVAHRFYLHKGLDITSHHFAMKLQPREENPPTRQGKP